MVQFRHRLRQTLFYLSSAWPGPRSSPAIPCAIASELRPGTAEIFKQLAQADQVHAIDVAMGLAELGAPPDLVIAGLLHDIGKVQDSYRITVADRIAHVLMCRFAPTTVDRLRRSIAPRGGTQGLWALSVHDHVGAGIVRDLGYGDRIEWLVRHHQTPDPDDPDLLLLQVMDNRVPRRIDRYN
ncbi:MAG TPA: HD domain-containing protein [Thermomicrobiales bacterium]|nr:HD domain-containing protein [Thermomicrobiales bacterium]